MNRTELIQLIEAALAAVQPTYARQVAEAYLADWPSDLGILAALGRAQALEGNLPQAALTLAAVALADPEDFAVQRRLGEVRLQLGDNEGAAVALACAHVGDGLGSRLPLPAWAAPCRAAFVADRTGEVEVAQRQSLAALQANPNTPLPALLHLSLIWHSGKLDLARPLAEGFHARWPGVVALKLCLAESLLTTGEPVRAIELLHEAAALDAAGQVVARHWGATHPYRALWPSASGASLPGPMPAEVVSALGLNRLPGSTMPVEPARAKRLPFTRRRVAPPVADSLADIQARLDSVAARLPSRVMLKHRLLRMKSAAGQPAVVASPVLHYVLVSSRTRLIQLYGDAGFAAVHTALQRLMAGTRRRSRQKPLLLYVDDPATLSPYGLRPVNPANAWDIKLQLAKLSERLQAINGTIGALLIVGGPDVIPFHLLPNPTDDVDGEVPSDNPYGTRDDNYFIPEWPVGRLPTGTGRDPAPLVHALDHAAQAPARVPVVPQTPLSSEWLRVLAEWLRQAWVERARQPSFGYSANVWKPASTAVYATIGQPRELRTSPPLDANALPVSGLAPARLSYFNLHGIEDGPEWYGQRSSEDTSAVPEYPVALRPLDVVNSGHAPDVVFSEACYGANILGKTSESALCLKFLDSGTRALVASTKIAYGAVSTPLVGADLLGRWFWQYVSQGFSAGESLRRAKIQMAQEMHQRQGFLDGEDQKTLISFVLYGDPLTTAPGPGAARERAAHPLPVPKVTGPLETVCDKAAAHGQPNPHQVEISAELLAQVKSVVARYLPGMEGADLCAVHAHAGCDGQGHQCPTAQLHKSAKRAEPKGAGTTVVTLSKTIRTRAYAHPHYARVTLDAQGQVVKLAVSR